MNHAEISIKTVTGKVLYDKEHFAPASWAELTGKHLLQWSSVMHSNVTVVRGKIILAALMYRIPLHLMRYIPKSRMLLLAETTEFLFRRNDLENWLIPSFWHRFRKYYGPKKRLGNITADEFTLCEMCYEQIDNVEDPAKKMEYLNTLCAILYRPRRWFGIVDDIRVPLTPYGYEKRAKLFKKLPSSLKWAIYLNYEGCRNFIIKKNPEVFKRGKQSDGRKAATVTAWSKIVESAAGDILGTLSETEKANVHKFMSLLGKRIKEAREMEERLSKK